MNQFFSKIWIVVAVAIFAVAGIFCWQYFNAQKEKEIPQEKITELEMGESEEQAIEQEETNEDSILIETTIKGDKGMDCLYKGDTLKFSNCSLKIIDECRQKHIDGVFFNKRYQDTTTTHDCYAKIIFGDCIEGDNFSWSSPIEVRGAASCSATIKKCPEK